MIKEELYNKTVGILVDAYFNDTLRVQDCAACAVGNIIAANNRYEVMAYEWTDTDYMVLVVPRWTSVFHTNIDHKQILNTVDKDNNGGCDCHQCTREHGEDWLLGMEQIATTGYTVEELMKVEYAFEVNHKGEDPMFNSLCAVIDVLDEIHQNTDKQLTKTVKQKFVKV